MKETQKWFTVVGKVPRAVVPWNMSWKSEDNFWVRRVDEGQT